MTDFATQMTAIITTVTSALSLLLEPPILYFTAAAGVGVVIKLVKKLMPIKKG